ncbi:hypothetical protein K435DRAFT_939099 [Dendrothele bispora CBS 962.96]|uniref:Putative 5'-nucleotidase C-terminal domain-containing protein n=1 Tax=Dendrothele bispora (strain CBS 962.96) TaxID=1314807 RepID=A0A4S8KXH8_DENBC|nr:hypothetical protein K435DRAFT_939099 [Dendrothele bispora CBS 962.96]
MASNAFSERFNSSFQFGVAPQELHYQPSNLPKLKQVFPPLMDTQFPPFLFTVSGSNFSLLSSSSSDFVMREGTNTYEGVVLDEDGEFRKKDERLGELGSELEKREQELYKRGDVKRRHDPTDVSDEDEDLTLSYVMTASCPGIGSDKLHTPLKSFGIPDFISSDNPFAVTIASSSLNSTSSNSVFTNSTLVDLVFVDFIQDQLGILINIQAQKREDKTKEWVEEDV